MSGDDCRPRLYGVKMRASLGGEHISGAERIVPPWRIAGTLSALCRRAFGHERGAPDSVNMKVEALGEVSRIRALPVFEVKVPDAAAGWARAVEILSAAGVSRAAEIAGLFTSAHSMRGAMLVDADTLERLEPDHARGVRATNMDGDPSPPADRKDHFAEALTLASKVLSTPGIVGEICVSDDPSYVTGYVATKDGYHRISVLKERGDPRGGRIFIYGGDRRRVAEAIRRLESAPVVVERAASPRLPRMEGIAADLAALDAAGLTRKIRMRRADVVSFADNDYLGLAGDPRVKAAAAEAAEAVAGWIETWISGIRI